MFGTLPRCSAMRSRATRTAPVVSERPSFVILLMGEILALRRYIPPFGTRTARRQAQRTPRYAEPAGRAVSARLPGVSPQREKLRCAVHDRKRREALQ